MFTVLLVLQVLMGIAIIGLVLLQQGKGADMGAAFGAGASGTVFGAAGGGSFFTRVTAVLAALFFANSILLSSPLVREVPDASISVTESVPVEEQSDVPVVDDEPVAEQTDLPPGDVPAVPAEPVAEPPETQAPPETAPAAEGGGPAKPE
ncbi:MAG: preprotein translocase subunit SecG [Gammaproteobacteria bacterium]|jgi:preprotein translocase subunit SecG